MANDNERTEESGFTYQVSAGESLSEAVIQAVSAISGSDPVPETPSETGAGQALGPLYTVVDPEALDSVFQPTDSDVAQPGDQVTFPYHGYEVTVRSGGSIFVNPL